MPFTYPAIIHSAMAVKRLGVTVITVPLQVPVFMDGQRHWGTTIHGLHNTSGSYQNYQVQPK